MNETTAIYMLEIPVYNQHLFILPNKESAEQYLVETNSDAIA